MIVDFLVSTASLWPVFMPNVLASATLFSLHLKRNSIPPLGANEIGATTRLFLEYAGLYVASLIVTPIAFVFLYPGTDQAVGLLFFGLAVSGAVVPLCGLGFVVHIGTAKLIATAMGSLGGKSQKV
jgi:hypothetical protein